MPKHRGLNLKKFVAALDPSLLDKYFVELVGEEKLPPRIWMQYDLLTQFLDNPDNVLLKGVVLEQLQQINDLATAGKSTIVWVYNHNGILYKDTESPTDLAMRLYLSHPDQFRYAYAWHQWLTSGNRMSEYPMSVDDFELTKDGLDGFQEDVTEWFRDLAKGDTTEVRSFENDQGAVILVTHGSYIRTVAEWAGTEVTIRSFRPATEDILLYNPEEGLLRIKATLEKDRKHYVQAFATEILGDCALAQEAGETPAFSLEPFATGQFDFTGNSQVTRIELTEAKLELAGETEPRVHLKSDDLMRSLQHELGGFSLTMGELKYVRLRFHLRIGGKESKQNVEIAPPERSDLSSAKHEEVISAYLQEQEVKLL